MMFSRRASGIRLRLIAGIVLALAVSACGGDDGADDTVVTTDSGDVTTTVAPSDGREEPTTTSAEDALRVGIAWPELQSGYFVGTQQFAEARAAELGVELVQTDATNDIARQLANVNEILTQGVDVLVIGPVSSAGLEAAVTAAEEAGVPVMSWDRMIDDAEGRVVVHTGASASEVGYVDGQMICDLVGPDARVLRARGVAGDAGANARQEGFLQAISEDPNCEDVEVLEEQFTDFDPDRTIQVVSDWLQVYPEGSVDAIMADADLSLDVVAEILRENNREEIALFGAGYYGGFVNVVCSDEPPLGGTVHMNLEQQANDLIETAIKVANSDTADLPEWVVTNSIAITSENCGDYEPIG